MFTGIIEAVGSVRRVYPRENAVGVYIDPGELDLTDVAIGDSIAVNGVCLTVTAFEEGCFTVDVSGETLSCTYGLDIPGNLLNLEKALRLADMWRALARLYNLNKWGIVACWRFNRRRNY